MKQYVFGNHVNPVTDGILSLIPPAVLRIQCRYEEIAKHQAAIAKEWDEIISSIIDAETWGYTDDEIQSAMGIIYIIPGIKDK